LRMTNNNYSIYYTRVIFHSAASKEIEIVAIDEDAAKADIIEAYGADCISYIHIARLRAA
jgi:acetate kinase